MGNLRTMLLNLSIPISLAIPILILYCLAPNPSFDAFWKGRAFYLLFLWLVFLEILMSSEEFTHERLIVKNPLRLTILIATATIPVIYVILVNLFGFQSTIIELGKELKIPWVNFNLSRGMMAWLQNWSWPLSLEYIVLALCFIAEVWLAYKTKGLKMFSISLLFLSAVGALYMIDTLYPFGSGSAAPFQAIVPITALLAARILNVIGYKTFLIGNETGMPTLLVYDPTDPMKRAAYQIGWPCAGVEGLFLYTLIMLLLLKKTPVYVPSFAYKARSILLNKLYSVNGKRLLPKKCKAMIKEGLSLLESERFLTFLAAVVYFSIGAVGTYITNAFRIAAIFVISITQGSAAASTFHDVYGGLLTLTWIMVYMVILMFLFYRKK